MLNCLPLRVQIRQRTPPDILRLQRYALTFPQPLRAAIQAVGSGQQLLPLLELVVRGRVVGIAVAEERFAVVGERLEFAFVGVDVAFEIAEALVDLATDGRGDVLLFDAHLVELPFHGQFFSGLSLMRSEISRRYEVLLDKSFTLIMVRTSSLASSSACSACRTAAFRGSPDSSGI